VQAGNFVAEDCGLKVPVLSGELLFGATVSAVYALYVGIARKSFNICFYEGKFLLMNCKIFKKIMLKSKTTRYDFLFYLVIIPLFGLGVYYVNYVFILIGFVLAIPLNFLIYKEFKKEGKEKAFFKNKLQVLGVGSYLSFLF